MIDCPSVPYTILLRVFDMYLFVYSRLVRLRCGGETTGGPDCVHVVITMANTGYCIPPEPGISRTNIVTHTVTDAWFSKIVHIGLTALMFHLIIIETHQLVHYVYLYPGPSGDDTVGGDERAKPKVPLDEEWAALARKMEERLTWRIPEGEGSSLVVPLPLSGYYNIYPFMS